MKSEFFFFFNFQVNWFTNYNRTVASYMSTIGNVGVDLFTNLHPPKSLYVQVASL